jgi:hypothetical protein
MGRTIGKSLDCDGVVWASLKECGANPKPTIAYRALPCADVTERGLLEFADRTDSIEDAHLWQVVIGRQARHIVVPVGDGFVVHASAKARKVVLERWVHPILGLWRLRGVS